MSAIEKATLLALPSSVSIGRVLMTEKVLVTCLMNRLGSSYLCDSNNTNTMPGTVQFLQVLCIDEAHYVQAEVIVHLLFIVSYIWFNS